ncbi:MAG: hypothetical protein IH985_08580, partial [Planctomycetes bacterium]|nr:hypothetical protein [Planctomycetota bacterium]
MRRILGIVAVCAVGTSAWGQQLIPAFGGFAGGGGVVDGTVVYDNSTNLLGSGLIAAATWLDAPIGTFVVPVAVVAPPGD